MANEEMSFQDELKEAPPAQVTAQEDEAAKASAAARVAKQLSDATSDNPVPNFDFKGLANQNQNPTPSGPAPGSMGWHLANAFKTPAAQAPGGGVKALFSGVTDALLHGNDKTEPTAAASAVPAGSADAWASAQSNADMTPSTSAPIAAPKKNFIDTILAAVGDASAGAKERGAIAGFIKTAGAKTQREREEQADRVSLAHANATMLHEQMLVHKLGEDQIAAATATGKEAVGALLNGEASGRLIAEGKTSDDIKRMIDNKELDPTKQTVFLTGRIPAGKDINGAPRFRSTYSVVEPAGEVEINEKQAKYLEDHGNQKVPVGTKIPAIQFNGLWQNAQSHEASDAARKLALKQIGEKIDKADLDHDAEIIGSDAQVQGAITAASTGPSDSHTLVKAYNALVNNADFMKAHPNFTRTYPVWAGGGDAKKFETMQENYGKAQDKNKNNSIAMLDEIEKSPEKMVGKTDALIPALEAMIKNPSAYSSSPADLLKRATDQLAIVKSVASHELDSKVKEAGAKQKAQNEAELGDVDELIESAKTYDLDPEKQFGNRAGMRAAVMNKFLKETGSQWNEGEYLARKQTTQDFRPAGKSGAEIRSLNTFAGHVGTAIDRIPELNNSSLPDWNTAMNKIATKVGDEQYHRMQIALEAVKDEYLNFIKNQHAPTKEELERAETMVNPNASPKDLHGVLAQMADTVGIRGGQLQRSYMNQMGGKVFKGLLDPDSDQILKNLGVDTNKMNGLSKAAKNAPAGSIQRPADLPSAVATMDFKDKNGVVHTYWVDAAHKPLRIASDIPKE